MSIADFYQKQRAIPHLVLSDGEAYVRLCIQVFDGLVDFLRDESTFPHPEINKLITLLWYLIGNKEVPIALDQWGISTLSYLVLGKGRERTSFFIMPVHFIDAVRSDPWMQLGAVVNLGSQGKDYFCQRIDTRTRERAEANEAEALFALKKLCEAQDASFVPNSYQTGILQKYPEGLLSLRIGVNYPTPLYPRGRAEKFREN